MVWNLNIYNLLLKPCCSSFCIHVAVSLSHQLESWQFCQASRSPLTLSNLINAILINCHRDMAFSQRTKCCLICHLNCTCFCTAKSKRDWEQENYCCWSKNGHIFPIYKVQCRIGSTEAVCTTAIQCNSTWKMRRIKHSVCSTVLIQQERKWVYRKQIILCEHDYGIGVLLNKTFK